MWPRINQIGHLLLGPKHSSSEIMRAVWGRNGECLAMDRPRTSRNRGGLPLSCRTTLPRWPFLLIID
jgi:hypothetical protein